MALMRPVNDCPWNASTVAVTRLADANLSGLDAGNRELQPQRVDLEQRDDRGRRLHVLAERHAAFADVAGERRDDGDVGDSLFGERELRPGLRQRGARGVDVLHRCLRRRAGLIGDRASRRRRWRAATRIAAPSSAPACSATRRASRFASARATAARASSCRSPASTPCRRTSTAALLARTARRRPAWRRPARTTLARRRMIRRPRSCRSLRA